MRCTFTGQDLLLLAIFKVRAMANSKLQLAQVYGQACELLARLNRFAEKLAIYKLFTLAIDLLYVAPTNYTLSNAEKRYRELPVPNGTRISISANFNLNCTSNIKMIS